MNRDDMAPEPNEYDVWKSYRDSGCKCQVEDAAGFPTIVLHSAECPDESHRAKAAEESRSDKDE